MSRQENYFHPVKDLLSSEMRTILKNHFFRYEKEHTDFLEETNVVEYYRNHQVLRDIYTNLGYEQAGVPFEKIQRNILALANESSNWAGSQSSILLLTTHFIIKNDLNVEEDILLSDIRRQQKEVESQGIGGIPEKMTSTFDEKNFARFHTSTNNEMLFSNETQIKYIVDLYSGNSHTFLHTSGNNIILPRHIDPGRECCITFPLFPDYSEYRNCRFYNSFDKVIEPEPIHTVRYNKIRSPVLLNNQKIHEIGGDNVDKETLCFQITYNRPYKEVRKILSEKGLLTTTI